MNKFTKLITLFLLAVFLVPNLVTAATISKTNSISDSQTIDSNLYFLGDNISISGNITKDSVVIARKVKVDGEINVDLLTIAATVDLLGKVGDDVRIVAGEVTISGEIVGDLVVVADQLTVLESATVGGDVIFFGNNAKLGGVINGDISGRSGSFRLDGEVAGAVDVTATTLVLGEKAKIAGNVSYISRHDLVRAQNSTVSGKIIKNSPIVSDTDNSLRWQLIYFLVIAFAVLVWYLFFKNFSIRAVSYAEKNPLRSTFVGFEVLILTPVIVAILTLTMLGTIVGIVLLTVYILFILVAILVTPVLIGTYVVQLFEWKNQNYSVLSVFLGTVILTSLLFIPVVGLIVFLAVFLITLGTVAINIYKLLQLK